MVPDELEDLLRLQMSNHLEIEVVLEKKEDCVSNCCSRLFEQKCAVQVTISYVILKIAEDIPFFFRELIEYQ